MKDVHEVQANILKVLLFNPTARFSDLQVEGITSDHFTFHLKRLIDLGLVRKQGEAGYELTPQGKEFANRFDTDSARMVIEKQAKVGALIICVRGEGEGRQYLVQQRLKQPFFGFHGFVTGKVKWGELAGESAARELQEETGLNARLTLMAIKHKMDYNEAGSLLEDKYFFVFKAEDTHGTLTETFEGGRNVWLTEEEIHKLPDLFDGVANNIKHVNEHTLYFDEAKYTVKKY